MRANLVLDLLNRIIENRIDIWDEITFNIEDSELDIVKEEFLSNHKRTSDREIISLIIKHTETVYKWIVNQLKIEYQRLVLHKATFRHCVIKNKINEVLALSDWTQLTDSGLTLSEQIAQQDLRAEWAGLDLSDPDNVILPTMPMTERP